MIFGVITSNNWSCLSVLLCMFVCPYVCARVWERERQYFSFIFATQRTQIDSVKFCCPSQWPRGLVFFFKFLVVGWVYLVRRPLFDLLYQPRWWVTSVEQSMECELAGETELLGESQHQCHFVHHKSHMTWLGHEPGPPLWRTGD
jgi:hypothetical protein